MDQILSLFISEHNLFFLPLNEQHGQLFPQFSGELVLCMLKVL